MILAVIPLRLESTRIPRKILADIRGETLAARGIARALDAFSHHSEVAVIAAVDDLEVKALLEKKFPTLSVVLTSQDLTSGTDRVFAAATQYLSEEKIPQEKCQGVINIQGDMPYMGKAGLLEIAKALKATQEKTLMLTLSQDWPSDQPLTDLGAVKVISDKKREAIYFSRYPIPYSRIEESKLGEPVAEMHIGVYGFTLSALADFCAQGAIALERAESLEQLRALWLGIPLLVLKTEVEAGSSYRGIDVKEDLEWARAFGK